MAANLNDARVLERQRALHARFNEGKRAFDDAAGAGESGEECDCLVRQRPRHAGKNLRTTTPITKFCMWVGGAGESDGMPSAEGNARVFNCIEQSHASASS